MLINKRESITLHKLSYLSFRGIANIVLHKGKSAITRLLKGQCCLLNSIKAKLFSKNFSKNSDNSGISLLAFSSKTNLKLHISVIPKLVKKVITNIDSSKASGPDCIPVLVLMNCEPELSYGVIHKGCPHKVWNFWDPPLPVHILLTTPPVRADTRLALFETMQLVNNSHWRVKKTDHSDTGCTHMCDPIRQFRQ